METDNRERLSGMVSSLEFFLNPQVVEDEGLKRQISDHLTNGNLVKIRAALQNAVAERMFTCLDQFSNWQVYEDYSTEFHYHHHNIYPENAHYPPDLNWCREVFGSESTKALIGKLSGRDCTGPTMLSASLYLPGDHSLPHTDFTGREGSYRQVAFVWHLTKNWQANWGGALYWCKTGKYVIPSFNSLLLFNVGTDSDHLVTTVSPYARSKRLAISGWWTSKHPTEDPHASDDEIKTPKLVELI
jgi:hypothetical protein